jgi:hypothetical protein
MNGDITTRDRAIGLFLLAFLAFNYPLLSLFGDGWVFGFPLLYAYLFLVWLGLILIMGLIQGRAARDQER